MLRHFALATAMIMVGAANQAAQGQTATVLPAGTQVFVRVDQIISSGNVESGDRIDGELASALLDNRNHVLVPQGTDVTMEVTNVVPGNSYDQPADLTLQLSSLDVEGGHSTYLVSYPVNRQGMMGYANPGTQVATSEAVNFFSMLGGRLGMIGYMGTEMAMAHDATPRSHNVGYQSGEVVTFVLSNNAVIAQ